MMGLFTPAWMNKDDKKAISAIRKIHDQNKLKRIVEEARTKWMCETRKLAVIENLTDREALVTLACQCAVSRKCAEAAFQKLTAGEDLFTVALSDGCCALSAADAITNESMLDRLALEARNSTVRAFAVKKINDPDIIARIAKNDDNEYARQAALEKTSDPAVITDAARHDASPRLRQLAVTRLENQDVLAEIASTDADADIRIAAINKLLDQHLLEKLARSDSSHLVRQRAAGRITDRSVRYGILLQDPASVNREIAVKKMDAGDERLLAAAKNEPEFSLRRIIVGRIKDKEQRLKLLKLESDKRIMSDILDSLELEDLLAILSDPFQTRYASYAYSTLKKKHKPDPAMLKHIASTAAEKSVAAAAQADHEKAEFTSRLDKSERGQKLHAAIKKGSACEINEIQPHDEDTVNALLLLMEQRGSEWGCSGIGPSSIGYDVYRAISELYKHEPQLRKSLSRERLKKYDLPHYDQGGSNCHNDDSPIVFDFETKES